MNHLAWLMDYIDSIDEDQTVNLSATDTVRRVMGIPNSAKKGKGFVMWGGEVGSSDEDLEG